MCRRDAAAYEILRSEALRVGSGHGTILLRHGLAVWLDVTQPSGSDPLPSRQLPTKPSSGEIASHGPLPATFAAIIIRLTKEAARA